MQPQDPCKGKSLPNQSPCIPGLLLCLGDTILNELPTLMNSTLQSCPQGFHPSPSPTQPPRSALTAFPTLLRILGSISSITHKSCCSHSTSRLSTVHNSQLVRKTRVNYLTILVARATALFFCLFASSVPGKTPRQCSG